ncbi:MAG: NBR1-Ig-like domain-containing protein [Anaerolineales bacterium]|nr:NBR1-Ig-like domain-containing protein [Anaerolineales bacterium]
METRPCFQATFIEDVTYRDGARVSPGEIFLKIWRFRNDGSCEWSYTDRLDFVGGERFSGPDDVKIRFFEEGTDLDLELGDRDWSDGTVYHVPPGATVDIAVVLRAPLEEGRHRGYWRVLAEDGENASMQFYVDVEVLFTLEEEKGLWSGEWEHETHLSERSGNPLVLHQDGRQIEGFYYNSDGEVFLIEASLSSDEMRMEGSFGEAWQAGFPFILELFPNQNAFHGLYNDSSFSSGPWCGSRNGYAVPIGECLLEP